MIFEMILLGLANADGFFTQTQNAVTHYRNAYYSRNSGAYASPRSTSNSFSKYISNEEHSVKYKMHKSEN